MGQQQMDGSLCMPYLSWFLGLALEVCEHPRSFAPGHTSLKTLLVLDALPAGSVWQNLLMYGPHN